MNSGLWVQRGQALAEAAVMLGVLAGLMGAVHVTGIWQDEAMRAAQAARQAAFAYTRFAPAPEHDTKAAVSLAFAAALTDGAQPGATHHHAVVLRREWNLGDADVISALALAPMSHTPQAGGLLTLARHTAVLRDAGHSAGDAQVQQRVGQSARGWQTAARRSASAGQTVAARMHPVDRAWGRAQPIFDWLSDWTARVPPTFLHEGGKQP